MIRNTARIFEKTSVQYCTDDKRSSNPVKTCKKLRNPLIIIGGISKLDGGIYIWSIVVNATITKQQEKTTLRVIRKPVYLHMESGQVVSIVARVSARDQIC